MHPQDQQTTTPYAAKAPYVTPTIRDYGDAQAITQTSNVVSATVTSDAVTVVNPPVYYNS